MNSVKKIPKNFKTIVRQQLILKFNNEVTYIKQVIMQAYDELLIGVVTDRKSKTNPLFYKDEFKERLDSFKYIKEDHAGITISVPDMDTFDFSGRLRVLKTIMEENIESFSSFGVESLQDKIDYYSGEEK